MKTTDAVCNFFDSPYEYLINTNQTLYHTQLKEFLQIYEIQKEKKRTLVFFIERVLTKDIVDILYRLQNVKKVVVILVSLFQDVFELTQFPRNLKFLSSYGVYELLIDVIKKPTYNRFEFSKNLPSSKDRSCLKNVTVVLVADEGVLYGQYPEEFVKIFYLNALINHNFEILNVRLLGDSTTTYDKRIHFLNKLDVDFRNKTSLFDQIKESGVLAGNKTKVFLFIMLNNNTRASWVEVMQDVLKINGQSVVDLQITDLKYRENFDYLSDLLVDAGCK